tara:strand:+ start:911 stop:1789 length:879 start_codon:yes stop_codon:yes gene_type:complete
MKFVKLDIFGFVDKPMRRKDQTSALKKFGKSKEFKITKVPAQKAPDRFSSLEARNVADKAARKKFGKDWFDKETSKPAITGMSTKALTDIAAEGYATKASERLFTKTLTKEMSASRKRTATFIKGASSNVKASIRPKKVTPKFVVPKVQYKKSAILSRPKQPGKKGFDPIFRFPKQAGQTITGKSKIVPSKGLRKAKSKGAMKSYMTAQSKSDAAFAKITERFTSRVKASPFKNRTIAVGRPLTGFDKELSQSVQRNLEQGFESKVFYKGLSKSGKISKQYAKFIDKSKKFK